MPVHVENLTSELTVSDGDLPLGDGQIEKLVRLVLQRLERQLRETEQNCQATTLRNTARPRVDADT